MVNSILVGMNSCGIASGAKETLDAIRNGLISRGLSIPVKVVGCSGNCYREPFVEVLVGKERIGYGDMTQDRVGRLLDEHIVGGKEVEEWVVRRSPAEGGREFDRDGYFNRQVKIVLENSGTIDPESLDDYLAANGYKALQKALKMTPEEIINEIDQSGLRGRGGAGFPTGMKWKLTRNVRVKKKFVICNGDEGDPGAFMDRNVLEGDPHKVIEGMIIGAFAVGSDEGYVYCRAEYPLAIKRLLKALDQARARGYLGKDILGSGFSFDIHVKEGAGAFVCGEETALIHSIEGKRGMPRPRPPYPSVKGLFGASTMINNVETWANVAWIIRNGALRYAAMGLGKSKGTKVFALAGKVKRGGNVEVPMGMSLKEILYEIAGGSRSGKDIKAVQMGGPSGGCIPSRLFDTPVTYEHMTQTGAIVGSGGMVVMDTDTCMVDVAKFFQDFTVKESCGKCTFCRLGTKRMLELLIRISGPEGTEADIEALAALGEEVKTGSLCGLGQTAPNPALTSLRYFKDEFMAHVRDKRCPSLVCKPLMVYGINEKCIGCTACARVCPVKAISGTIKQKHIIDRDACIRCGSCLTACRFGAIAITGLKGGGVDA